MGLRATYKGLKGIQQGLQGRIFLTLYSAMYKQKGGKLWTKLN